MERAEIQAALTRTDPAWIVGQRWFGAKGRAVTAVALDEGFVLDPGPPHVLAIASLTLDDGTRQRYQFALTGQPLRLAEPGDGVWRELAVAMAAGRTLAALPTDLATATDPTTAPTAIDRPHVPVSAALVCRPGVAMPAAGPGTERDLGADQSNTSVVLGETVLLKAYRRLQPGLNPDLEMTAFLGEQARFAAVPALAGYVELVEARHGATTLAMAQAFVPDGQDAFEAIADTLTAWLLAPGEISLGFATEMAADLGTLTAGLHHALSDGHGLTEMAPRDVTRQELRRWATQAQAHAERAVEIAPAGSETAATLRALAPRIAESLQVLDALPTTPRVIRAHGDLHLGQILVAPDGFRIVDFEGEPSSTPDERRAHRHPLRDVASMLRSIDHVGRSAARRAEARNGSPLVSPGLDLPGWLVRARERYLAAYRAGLRGHGQPHDIDPALLLAFEVDKELYEVAYAASYLPSWLWAPTAGLQSLFDRTSDAR